MKEAIEQYCANKIELRRLRDEKDVQDVELKPLRLLMLNCKGSLEHRPSFKSLPRRNLERHIIG
jgi:hypothetical protein